jgi:hypothetical protein
MIKKRHRKTGTRARRRPNGLIAGVFASLWNRLFDRPRASKAVAQIVPQNELRPVSHEKPALFPGEQASKKSGKGRRTKHRRRLPLAY